MKLIHNQHALHRGFELLTTLPHVDCSSSLAHNLQDRVYRQNDQTWSVYFSTEVEKKSTVHSGKDLLCNSVPSASVRWIAQQ